MASTKHQARVAGVLYLVMGVIAPIGLEIVPGKLIVSGNPAATVEHIRASEGLVRLSIASELIHQAIGVFLVLALYRLFKAVDDALAKQLVVLGALVSVPIMFVNVLNEIAALFLVSGNNFLSAFGKPQLDALAYLFFRLHGQGITVASIFWGLWLFPFGLLVIRSGFIPRVIGFLLMIAGSAYLASSFTTLILPMYAPMVSQVTFPLYFGELPIMFWLLIWGARTRPAAAPAAPVGGSSGADRAQGGYGAT
jgi:Domain of unknown function (DUF4386)